MRHLHVLSEANGPVDADVMFVAEAPGRLGAARTGIPLTADASGRRFDAFLVVAGLCRERVFVTNAVLCLPVTPGGLNRRPTRGEVRNCKRFLSDQIRFVSTKRIVTLGAVALEALAMIEPHELVLARDVGRHVPWRGRTLVPLYHPSIQSTLHRPHDQQLEDWRELGRLVRAAGP
jgi:DNA polymerase